MKLETFREKFSNLYTQAKIEIYNNYCLEHGDPNKEFMVFDNEFFKINFKNPFDSAKATFFGKIKNWSDEYIRFNAYGNLESFTNYEAEWEADDYVDDIYEYPDVWGEYIDDL